MVNDNNNDIKHDTIDKDDASLNSNDNNDNGDNNGDNNNNNNGDNNNNNNGDNGYKFKEQKHETISQKKHHSQWHIGRAPWYNTNGVQKEPFIIGVTGGSASGKTTVCREIIDKLNLPWVRLLSTDNYYKGLTEEEIKDAVNYNFDHPDAFDWEALKDTLLELKNGKIGHVPNYSFKTHSRLPGVNKIYGADVIIVEGILVLHDKSIRDLLDMKIFVSHDDDLRLARRIKRDILERGRNLENVLQQYTKTVKPAFDEFIKPTKKYADVIIPSSPIEQSTQHNSVAIQLLVQHVRHQLKARGTQFSTEWNNKLAKLGADKNYKLPPKVSTLEKTNDVISSMTVLRDRDSNLDEFVRNSDNILQNLVQLALVDCKYEDLNVVTPTKEEFKGKKLVTNVCGISVGGADDCMEDALRECIPGAKIGNVTIEQKENRVKGPRLYYCKLPKDVERVIIMIPTMSTGNVALMAIRVLLDHGVDEENISVLCIVCSRQSVLNLTKCFPNLRIVTADVDKGYDENYNIVPGIGNFVDRYYEIGGVIKT